MNFGGKLDSFFLEVIKFVLIVDLYSVDLFLSLMQDLRRLVVPAVLDLAICIGKSTVAARMESTYLDLSLGHLTVRILELVLKIGICDLRLSQLHLGCLAFSLELGALMLEVLKLGLSCVVLDLFLGLELSDLLLTLVKFFLCSRSLLTVHEFSIPVVFSSPLLDRIDFDLLDSYVVLQLSDLPLQTFNHLLSCAQNLIL